MRFLLAVVAVLVLSCGCLRPAAGVQPDEVLSDTRLEERARAISSQLRCLVCRNETIDDSNAVLARDLRLLVRSRLLAGDSDPEVIDFIVARYGEYVLLKPRLGTATLFLWLSPLLILISALLYLLFVLRHRKTEALQPLTPEEGERIRQLLQGEQPEQAASQPAGDPRKENS